MNNDRNYKSLNIDSEIFCGSSRLLIIGGSHSGKTYFVQKLVLRHHDKFKKIVICGTPNLLLQYSQTKDKTKIYDTIQNPFKEQDDDDDDKRGSLYVIDDLMSEAYNSQIVNDIFSKGRHHNISIILILQSYFPTGSAKSLIPQIKNNATIQIFFRLRNQSELVLAAKKLEFDKKSQEFFLDLIKREVCEKRYGYIATFLDELNPEGRYRNNLVFEDSSKYETVYTQK